MDRDDPVVSIIPSSSVVFFFLCLLRRKNFVASSFIISPSIFWKIMLKKHLDVIIDFQKPNDNKRRSISGKVFAFERACKLQAHLGNQPFLVAHLINTARKSGFVDNCGSSLCIMKHPNYFTVRLQIIKLPLPAPTRITSSKLLKNLIYHLYTNLLLYS